MKIKRKKAFKLPGEIFMKHVQFGLPKIEGMYACYYKYTSPESISSAFPVAGMTLLNFNKGKFFGNRSVLAWIGPLPTLSLDELQDNKECNSRIFYISNLKTASKYKFESGPYLQHAVTSLQPGKKGYFIFEVNTHKSIPNPISRYNVKEGKWKNLEKKDIKKYIKIMKKQGNK